MGLYDILDELDLDDGVETYVEAKESKPHSLARSLTVGYDPLGRFQTPVPAWMLNGDAPCVEMARERGLQETLEMFYGANTWQEAKRTCAPCPYRGDCREYADKYGEEGVWGGSSYPERNRDKENS